MEIALNFTLNFPLALQDGSLKGLPLPSDPKLTGLGSRRIKSDYGNMARIDLRNILGMPKSTDQKRQLQHSILTKYLTKMILDAELKGNYQLPDNYMERVISFLLSPMRGSTFRSNLLAIVNRQWVSNAQFLNALQKRIGGYLKGLDKSERRQQLKVVGLVDVDTGAEIDIKDEDETIDDRIERLQEELILKIKVNRLTDSEKYFLDIWRLQPSIPIMKKYELLGIHRKQQADKIEKKIRAKIRKPLTRLEDKLFQMYKATYEGDLDKD